MRGQAIRWSLVCIMLVGFFTVWQGGLLDLVSFDTVFQHRRVLQDIVSRLGALALILFALVYACLVAFSIPVGLVMTVTSGFLFGPWLGTFTVAIGATTGAVAVFMVAQTALGAQLRTRASPFMIRVQDGFSRNAVHYMLALRLIPLFPFWLVNIVAALADVRLFVYIWTTLIGILPSVFVFTLFGHSLNSLFTTCDAMGLEHPEHICILPDMSDAFTPQIWMTFCAVGALMIFPVFYRFIQKKMI